MPTIKILGLDLSLTGTGFCKARIDYSPKRPEPEITCHTGTLKTNLRGHERLQFVADAATHRMHDYTLVVLEGPAYGAQGGQAGHHERAGLWWLIAHRLWKAGTPYAVVAPSTRAKYACGRGNAPKGEVMAAAIRRYGHLADLADDNQCDALILAALGAHHIGYPLTTPTLAHSTALAAVQWPALISDNVAA